MLKNFDGLRDKFFSATDSIKNLEGSPVYWTLYRGAADRDGKKVFAQLDELTAQESFDKLVQVLTLHLDEANKWSINVRNVKQSGYGQGVTFIYVNEPDSAGVIQSMYGMNKNSYGIAGIGELLEAERSKSALQTRVEIMQLRHDIEIRDMKRKMRAMIRQQEEEAKPNPFVGAITKMIEQHGDKLIGPLMSLIAPAPAAKASIGEVEFPKPDPTQPQPIDFNKLVGAAQILGTQYARPDELLFKLAKWAVANPEIANQWLPTIMNDDNG